MHSATGEDLGPAFKRYRQAVFKLNYKINKLNAAKRGAAKVCCQGAQRRGFTLSQHVAGCNC